ncbi:MAG TPA: hypothetical protein VLK82_09485 [Candidatus Tectomicrobia bacterium]|nr:hypothetical protein [Candidatus Tectomicrobia bacterium]
MFYRVAIELIDLSIQRVTSVQLAEVIAVLLQTWNHTFYRYHTFDRQHVYDLERVLAFHQQSLAAFRQRSLIGLRDKDRQRITRVFASFEEILGPVGAAKTLHLLAPEFFPLWDRAIARAYGLPLQRRGRNAERYYRFMEVAEAQWTRLGGRQAIGRNPLKALDEYNYCRYTKGWISGPKDDQAS